MVTNIVEDMNPGSSRSAQDLLRDKVLKKIDLLVSDGYRSYLSKDLEEAAELLGQANTIAVDFFGQFAPECYKAHFYYGLTLLEMARCDANVIKGSNNFGFDERFPDDFAREIELIERENNERNEMEEADETSEAQNPSSSYDNPIRHFDTDEDSNIEVLAWESLEVARKICERMEISTNSAQEWLEKKVDVFVALAESSILAEQYNRAIDDLNNALQVQSKICRPHRRAAEIQYHIGSCYRSLENFAVAAETFKTAKAELESVIEIIKAKIIDPSDENFKKDKEEIKNLKSVIKELEESILDAKESEKFKEKHEKTQKRIITTIYRQVIAEHNTDNINDISSQVKRTIKRKLETNNEDEDDKKTKKVLNENDLSDTENNDKNNSNSSESKTSKESHNLSESESDSSNETKSNDDESNFLKENVERNTKNVSNNNLNDKIETETKPVEIEEKLEN